MTRNLYNEENLFYSSQMEMTLHLSEDNILVRVFSEERWGRKLGGGEWK